MAIKTVEEQLEEVQDKITEVLASNQGDYRIGDTSFDRGTFLKQLYEIEAKLRDRINAGEGATEYWDNVDVATDFFGRPLAELEEEAS